MKYKDIGKIVTGKTPSTTNRKYFEGHIPFITPEDISNGYLIRNTKRYISEDGYKSILANTLDGISVVTGCIGSDMGNVAIVDGKCASNQQINAITNIKEIYNPYYIYYNLSLKKSYFRQLAGSTTTPILPKSIFEDIDIDIPIKDIQDKIAGILKSIDDKIQNNTKINSELESMAKTIYDYWFLQFEFPNKEGKPYKSSGGKMVWNEELGREIPEGWEGKEIRSLISITRGVSYDKKDMTESKQKGYIPLLKANNIQDGNINYSNLIYVKEGVVSEEQFLDRSSVFITMSSGSKEHMGKTAIIFDSIPYTFGAFCSKIKIDYSYRAFLSTYFRGSLFKNSIEQLSIGTNINNINNNHIYGLKIPVPNQSVLEKYEEIGNPLLDKQGEISKENKELAVFRDFLLPLLMNGQVGFKEDISVKEIEVDREEVAASVNRK